MRNILLTVAVSLLCVACGSSGPVYRGSPPPGMSHRQYVAQLTGAGPAAARPEDRSPGRGSSVAPDPTPE